VLAGILSALCLWFAWRAYRRCRAIHSGLVATEATEVEADPVEERLAESELNLELNLARRNVQALGRAALFGGTGFAFWGLASGDLLTHPLGLWRSFGLGLLGWGGCRQLRYQIGSLADSWRAARRRRRQGVDPSERTG
jgi:hypothetical protein